MNDPGFVGFNAPVNQVWVAADWQDPRFLLARMPTTLWKFSDELDCLANGTLHVLRAARTSLVDVLENCCEIVPRAGRETNPHRPCRFQSASISASATNCPRRACSRPSRIAVRVSSSRATIGRCLHHRKHCHSDGILIFGRELADLRQLLSQAAWSCSNHIPKSERAEAGAPGRNRTSTPCGTRF